MVITNTLFCTMHQVEYHLPGNQEITHIWHTIPFKLALECDGILSIRWQSTSSDLIHYDGKICFWNPVACTFGINPRWSSNTIVNNCYFIARSSQVMFTCPVMQPKCTIIEISNTKSQDQTVPTCCTMYIIWRPSWIQACEITQWCLICSNKNFKKQQFLDNKFAKKYIFAILQGLHFWRPDDNISLII